MDAWRIYFAVCSATGMMALGACGGPVNQIAAPRPAAHLMSTSPNPCNLLTTQQKSTLDLAPAQQHLNRLDPGRKMCVWTNLTASPDEPGDEYLAALMPHMPNGSSSGYSRDSAPIENLPTKTYLPAYADAATSCGYVLSVTPHQKWWIQYTRITPGNSRINHKLACVKAQTFTKNLLESWRSRKMTAR
ncbi:MAG TPA: hypothetical protein VHU91_02260 [Mycobacteriales bacterium]|jgi:hypothetical protein|nr:hypothetical protein [Mycobacteriales bacterium]